MQDLSPETKYQIRVRAKTTAGFGFYSESLSTTTSRVIESSTPAKLVSKSNSVSILISSGIAALILSLLITLIYKYKRKDKMLCLKSSHCHREMKNQTQPTAQHQELLNERLIGKNIAKLGVILT